MNPLSPPARDHDSRAYIRESLLRVEFSSSDNYESSSPQPRGVSGKGYYNWSVESAPVDDYYSAPIVIGR
ncbi:hypothetical protein BLNAU_14960 [Blattamonas nauphoetae]|uniref:Uncharacterized protein n=1 Tax=Blattamonas nauphoetae TaxID=2049346 RepID=A0ABQ9XCC4_9EUKA|nr:hypothetical protein BLNAU_14960 [Blattamonas nauphoetae]